MVLASAPVKAQCLYARGLGPLSNRLADYDRRLAVSSLLDLVPQLTLPRIGRYQRLPVSIVDDLTINMLQTPPDTQPRPSGRPVDPLPDAQCAANA
jgi:hypothetical protein